MQTRRDQTLACAAWKRASSGAFAGIYDVRPLTLRYQERCARELSFLHRELRTTTRYLCGKLQRRRRRRATHVGHRRVSATTAKKVTASSSRSLHTTVARIRSSEARQRRTCDASLTDCLESSPSWTALLLVALSACEAYARRRVGRRADTSTLRLHSWYTAERTWGSGRSDEWWRRDTHQANVHFPSYAASTKCAYG